MSTSFEVWCEDCQVGGEVSVERSAREVANNYWLWGQGMQTGSADAEAEDLAMRKAWDAFMAVHEWHDLRLRVS